METTHELFERWSAERDGLEECRSAEEFKKVVAVVDEIENEIFRRTGMRPPYQKGFGQIAQSW